MGAGVPSGLQNQFEGLGASWVGSIPTYSRHFIIAEDESMDKKELLKRIPKIDEVLKDQRLFVFFDNTARSLIVEAARESVDDARERILSWQRGEPPTLDLDSIIEGVIEKIVNKRQKSLRRVINATGTILHTNLGRAKLPKSACNNVSELAANYSTLEYNLRDGVRGSRHSHADGLITGILGTEDSMVVNNNAAAVFLALTTLAKDKEVIVSRGELVEIGGSFRIPEIMELSGARLREVGTTNKTSLSDYKKASASKEAGALLKVHTSNYKVVGFTAEVPLYELVSLGRELHIPVIHDLGSGLMVDLSRYGVNEPTVFESVKAGADIILFSGDKLLGGAQAGIITGKKKYIELMKKHPLARIMRVDKMTLAALESVFREYLDMDESLKNIPILSMITASIDEIKNKASFLVEKAGEKVECLKLEVVKTQSQIGGGSAPDQFIPSYAVSVGGNGISSDKIERDLRSCKVPVIVRIHKDRVLIDMRTVDWDELDAVLEALVTCGGRYSRGNNEKA